MRPPKISDVLTFIVIGLVAFFQLGVFLFAAIVFVLTLLSDWSQKHKEKKRKINEEINSLKCRIEDDETQYDGILERAAKLGDERIFLLSYAEQLSISLQVNKSQLAALDHAHNIEKLNKTRLQERIDALQNNLSEYKKIDTYKMSNELSVGYKELIDILCEINESTFYIGQNRCRFTPGSYNRVFSEDAEVYALITKTGSIYFYPQYVVQANSETDFTISSWRDIVVSTRTENRYSFDDLPNGEVVHRSFLHTCKDGTRDLRYNSNPICYTYRYGIVTIMDVELAIPSSKLASRLCDVIDRIKSSFQ